MKRFKVTFYSRYYKFDTSSLVINAPSKKWIRDNWHSITHTDEYVVKKIEEMQ